MHLATYISIRYQASWTQPRAEYWMVPAHQRLAVFWPDPHPLNVEDLTGANQLTPHLLLLLIPFQVTADENPTLPFSQSNQAICLAQANCNKPGYTQNAIHVRCRPIHTRLNHRSFYMDYHCAR